MLQVIDAMNWLSRAASGSTVDKCDILWLLYECHIFSLHAVLPTQVKFFVVEKANFFGMLSLKHR